MLSKIQDWIAQILTQGAALLAAFFSGYGIGSLKQKNKALENELKDADRDRKILADTRKRGSALLNSLFPRKK